MRVPADPGLLRRGKLRLYAELAVVEDVPGVLLFTLPSERREAEARRALSLKRLTVATAPRLQLNDVEFATVMDKREARSRTPTETQVAARKSRRSRRKRMRVGAKTRSSGCCSTAEDAANRRHGGSREPTLAISDRTRVRVRSSPSCQNIYRVRLRSRADRISSVREHLLATRSRMRTSRPGYAAPRDGPNWCRWPRVVR